MSVIDKWHDRLVHADIEAEAYIKSHPKDRVRVEIFYFPEEGVVRKDIIVWKGGVQRFYCKGAEED